MKYLTFALAKGRLAKKSLALFEQIGISMDEMKDPDTRKLIFVNEDLKIKMFLAKASDVPTYVEYGAADIGVVGKDTLLEEGSFFLQKRSIIVNLSLQCRSIHILQDGSSISGFCHRDDW